MKKLIIYILIIIVGVFLIKQVEAGNKELGISEPVCRKDFKSAGVYDETLGIYSLTCFAEVSPEHSCKKWRFVVGKGATCIAFN